MLTNKNGRAHSMWEIRSSVPNVFRFRHLKFADFCRRLGLCSSLLALGILLAGCTPAGPRALLQGKRLLEHGQTAEAIEKLKTATSILTSNAQAWNYLGVAYHQAGQTNEAAEAYKRAITYDQNLIEARFNLGCLWLEQNRPDLAKPEFTAYTLRRDKTAEGWLKLGEAQLRTREITAAERSFNQVRQFDAQNPEALNGLGVAQMQRNRPTEAGQFFNAALKSKPDYAPALLNLALVSQFYLNNKQYALQRYHDYLAVTPRPANWDAVNAAARSLEQELNPPSQSAAVAAVRPATVTNTAPPQQTVAKAPAIPPRVTTKPEAPALAKPAPGPAPQQPPQQVVNVSPEPVIKSAQDGAGSPSEPVVVVPPGTRTASTATNNQKHGFFSRVFKGSTKASTTSEPAKATTNAAAAASNIAEPAPEPKFPRYSYHSVKKPQAGDHAAAEKAFTQALHDQQDGNMASAIQNYKKAVQTDPVYFDAYYNLGLASAQAGNLPQALTAYETALVLDPESHNARFNFALTLRRANYAVDAANELEKLLTKFPNDANAHYAVGAIYAQSLHQTAKAREHYQKTLELDPTIPQAVAIHDWLFANPH